MDSNQQNQMEITLAPASLLDLSAIRQIEQLAFPQDAWPLIEMLGVLSLPSILRWKAEDGKRLVAFVAADIRRGKDVAWIATIAVHPDYRRQGLANRLMEKMEGLVGMAHMRLSARASNWAALNLYQNRGYEQVDVWPKYYSGKEDAVVMEKALR